jgi:hypothetical protein
MKVRAYRPNRNDDPIFIAETYEDLQEKEGDYIGGPQCESCGNWTYQIQVKLINPGTKQYFAKCIADPAMDEQHGAECGAEYNIGIYEDREVVF